MALALSFERSSDISRIRQLLQHFAVVVSVSLIAVPTDPLNYGALHPYHLSGRYVHVQQDFSVLHLRDSLSPILSLFQYLSPRVAVLDYFHLAAGYYAERYGVHWLSHHRVGLPPQGGICHSLLRYVTDVFLPRDKGGSMDSMQSSLDLRSSHLPRLSFAHTHWNPLTRSDFQLSFDEPSLSPSYQLAHYLGQPPFLRVSLLHSSVSPPMALSPRSLLVVFGLSPSTLVSCSRISAYLDEFHSVITISIAPLDHLDPCCSQLLPRIQEGRYRHLRQPLPLAISEANWLLCQPLASVGSFSPRVACLDYFSLPPDAYTNIFGTNWLNYPLTNDIKYPAPGLAQCLLSFFDSLHLPYDLGGSLREMRQAYWRRKDSELSFEDSTSDPQHAIDARLHTEESERAISYLASPPFCAITLSRPLHSRSSKRSRLSIPASSTATSTSAFAVPPPSGPSSSSLPRQASSPQLSSSLHTSQLSLAPTLLPDVTLYSPHSIPHLSLSQGDSSLQSPDTHRRSPLLTPPPTSGPT